AAFFAAADRSAGERLRAADFVCLARASFETDAVPSRLSAFSVACERFRDTGAVFPFFAFATSRAAFFRVASETLPFFGGARFTPARLAFESPIAIACLAERAPCFPSRTWSISSRTNSPACVDGALPCALSCWARFLVRTSGIAELSVE
ncbi:MAG TPA: hypothetical protein VHW01_27640, partial [Polyangiaceae bacterium]|nr:hypothetical protein [Polyangiaceae bacterium]